MRTVEQLKMNLEQRVVETKVAKTEVEVKTEEVGVKTEEVGVKTEEVAKTELKPEHASLHITGDLIKFLMRPFQLFHSALSVLILMGVLTGLFFAYREIKENRVQVQKLATEQTFVNNALFKQSQQNTFYRIVDENLKASLADKLRCSQAVWNAALIKKVPLSLICAVWEHESRWIPGIVNSESGATGLGQQIPRYAMAYLRAMGLEANSELLKDPAVGGVVTVDQLYDHQTDWAKLKKIDWSNWTFALYSYSEGGRSVSSMNLTYATEIMTLRKKYQERGLE